MSWIKASLKVYYLIMILIAYLLLNHLKLFVLIHNFYDDPAE